MATDLWIVACKQPPNLNGTTLDTQCPLAQRITVQTTLEFFDQQGATFIADLALDPAMVGTVFFLAFSVVVLFFMTGRGVGSVLSLIRKG